MAEAAIIRALELKRLLHESKCFEPAVVGMINAVLRDGTDYWLARRPHVVVSNSTGENDG